MSRSEYQVEYCGQKGKGKGGGGSGEGGEGGLQPCKYNEDIQPVGGRVQTKYRDEMNTIRDELDETMGKTKMVATTDPMDENGYLPLANSVYSEDYTNEMTMELEKTAALESQQKGVYQMPWAPDLESTRALYMYRSHEITGPDMKFVPPVTMQPQQTTGIAEM